MSIVDFFASYRIDILKDSLWFSIFHIVFNPTYWNVVARLEYKDKVLTRIANGSAKFGCYLLALSIFVLGLTRDFMYERALKDQPTCPKLDIFEVKVAAAALFGLGNVLVLSSMWALGVTGTYLGDYFGILMDHRVTSFPFNVTNNPMYHGSTLCFLGTALWFAKPAGVLITIIVYVMYEIALRFEEPFTAMIYAKRDEELKKKAK